MLLRSGAGLLSVLGSGFRLLGSGFRVSGSGDACWAVEELLWVSE